MIEIFTGINKRVIVFGTGTAAHKMVSKSGIEVDYYVDNDENKWRTVFLGREVKAPSLLLLERKEEIVILVASMYYDDIKMQLEGMGYEECKGFYNFADFFINPLENAELNVDAFTDIIKAQEMIKNKDYLKAVEAYEKILIDTCGYLFKKYIYNELRKLESEYHVQICDQMDKYCRKECKDNKQYNLHLMFDHFHNKSFIEFINEFYPESANIFLIFYFDKHPKHISESLYTNVHTFRITGDDAISLMQGSVERFVEGSRGIFIHYLHDLFCELVIKSELKNRLIYWILWGGDIYSYSRDICLYDSLTSSLLIDIGHKGAITYHKDYELKKANIYRRAAIRRIDYVLTWIKGDYDALKRNFITNAKRLDYIFPNPVNFRMLDKSKPDYSEYDFKSRYGNVILLGNSADPSNNHMEILNYLSNFIDKSFCVILTLSYGNQEYAKSIIEIGRELLGNRFIPITEYIEPRKYCMLLRQVDVGIMNHNRQQGVGNILALLYLEKKVFMKSTVAPYKLLKEIGIDIYDERDLLSSTFEELFEFDMSSRSNNRRIIYENFNEARIKQCADLIFD